MKIGKHDITLKNIHAYLQGNLRYLAEQYGPEFIRVEPHIREQIMFRMDVSKPECIAEKKCTECHCDVPGLMYADKMCGGECYPEMMDKDTWEEFKKTLRIHTLENNIEKIGYPFDWRAIVAMMTIQAEELKEKEVLITGAGTSKIEDQIINLGDVVVGGIIIQSFTLYNPNNVNLFVKNVSTSCGCTTADDVYNKIIPANRSIIVDIKVNTVDKKLGSHSFMTDLLMNNNTKTKLKIVCNLIDNNENN